MTGWVAVVAVALLLAVILQSATGFGFALLAGPSLYAVMDPEKAVALLLILGLCVNVLVLGAERRKLSVDWHGLVPAMLAALPGLPIGALLVRVLPPDALRVAIGVIVCALVAHRLWRRAPGAAGRPAPGRVSATLAGLSAGVLTTSTTTNGPPLALWLGGRGLPPAVVRDTVSAAFLLLDFVGIGVVLAVVGPSRALAEAVWLPALVPVVVVGHLAGSWLFRRLPAHRYDQLLLLAVAAAGAVSIGTGVR
ncbi:MAG: uncharacterized protein QOE87_3302 [Gaiellales bacterium]|nr:uncharacterized protein [Gaiellales bacterium]